MVKKINSLTFACKGEVINSRGLGEILIPCDFCGGGEKWTESLFLSMVAISTTASKPHSGRLASILKSSPRNSADAEGLSGLITIMCPSTGKTGKADFGINRDSL